MLDFFLVVVFVLKVFNQMEMSYNKRLNSKEKRNAYRTNLFQQKPELERHRGKKDRGGSAVGVCLGLIIQFTDKKVSKVYESFSSLYQDTAFTACIITLNHMKMY